MATLQEVERAFLAADAAGDTAAATVLAKEVQRLRTQEPKSRTVGQTVGDLAAGAVRGAGSIGATLLAPIDAAARAVGVENDFIGRRDRREAMTGALQTMGADTDSLAFGAGKLGAEVAGTLGVGGALGAGAKAVGAAPTAVRALQTAGMTTGQPGGLALRTLAGGAVGGAAAGLVNPEDAVTGAAVGGALPGALKVAGAGGEALGRMVRGPAQTPDAAAAVLAARNAGYVIPPTQANPTLTNRLLEGMSGKITTAQNASARNQAVTNAKAAAAVGLPTDQPITAQALKAVRDAAGQAYDAVGQAGTIRPGQAYNDALDKIVRPHLVAVAGFPNAKPSPVITMVDSLRSDVFDAASAVAKIKELRSAADDAFRTGNTDIGRASKKASQALEDVLEAHLQSTGNTEGLKAFKDARQLIAKTYTVEKALNPTTGTVDAKKLGALIQKGKPVSGELREAGEFANRFPKAAQPVEQMGSLPQTSPLDWTAGTALSLATQNPLGLIGVAARPAARAAVLSPVIQNRLIQRPSALSQLLGSTDPQLLYRTAPVLMADQ